MLMFTLVTLMFLVSGMQYWITDYMVTVLKLT